MFDEGLKQISHEFSMNTYHDLISEMLCESPTLACHLSKCKDCPGFSEISDELNHLFQKHSITRVKYLQWTNVDRCSIEEITEDVSAFIQKLEKDAHKLLEHHFVSKTQSAYFKNLKTNLKPREFLAILDFAQNYIPVVQDAIQSQYWTQNRNQITVHPIVIYRSEHDENDQPRHDTFVMISECTDHNTVAVHLFIRKIIERLISQYGKDNVEKIYYFSDGAASQYKNKNNFINLVHHTRDFHGIQAEWHFFATSHGKNACDGVGGTVKRFGARHSLRGNLLLTARQFFDVVSNGIQSMKFIFFTIKDHEQEAKALFDRFQTSCPIKGTQSFHSYIPIDECNILCKKVSNLEYSDGTIHKIVK